MTYISVMWQEEKMLMMYVDICHVPKRTDKFMAYLNFKCMASLHIVCQKETELMTSYKKREFLPGENLNILSIKQEQILYSDIIQEAKCLWRFLKPFFFL